MKNRVVDRRRCSCPWLGGGTRDDHGNRRVNEKFESQERGRKRPRFNEPVDRENDNADEETEKGDDDDDDDVSPTLITTMRARTKRSPRLDNDRFAVPSPISEGWRARSELVAAPRQMH